MRSGLLGQSLLRSAIAIVAALWLLGGAVEHAWHAAVSLDGAHGSVSSSSGALAVSGDHAQCDSGLSPSCLVSTAAVDLPRWDTALLAFAVVATVATVGWRFDRVRQTRRGPPRGPATPITGRELLRRLCLARR